MELIFFSYKRKSLIKIKEFICSFVITILNCIDIIFNIILQIPANRILLITTNSKLIFSNSKNRFTEILKYNFIFANLKYREVLLYKFITYLKN